MFVYQSLSESPEPVSSLLVAESIPTPIRPLDFDLEKMPGTSLQAKSAPCRSARRRPAFPPRRCPPCPRWPSNSMMDRMDALSDPFDGFSEQFKKSFEARRGEMRARLVKEHGGTAESEKAVEEGLKWLARHQREDGSWSFDHLGPDCDKSCEGPGGEVCTSGPREPPRWRCCVFWGRGIRIKRANTKTKCGRACGTSSASAGRRASAGTTRKMARVGMYVQGFVGIALAEAYAMTRDDFLESPARSRLGFYRGGPGSRRRRVAVSAPANGGHVRRGLASDGPHQRPGRRLGTLAVAARPDHEVPGQRANQGRGTLRLYVPFRGKIFHNSHRPVVPDVFGMEQSYGVSERH